MADEIPSSSDRPAGEAADTPSGSARRPKQRKEQGAEDELSVEQPVESRVGKDAAAPVEEPLQEPLAEPAAQQPPAPPEPQQPTVAATLTAEPLPLQAPPADQGDDEDGGEWHLLLAKLRQWFDENELQSLWAQARRPVTSLAALIGLLLVLRVYSALLGALDSLPLIPGLLELAGVAWLLRYGVPKLLRSSERERLSSGLRNRWNAFRGKG